MAGSTEETEGRGDKPVSEVSTNTEKTIESEDKFQNLVLEKIHNMELQVQNIREDIRFSIAPRFLNVSTQTSDLIEFAIELWRMERRINKILPMLPEDQRDNLNNSIQKLERYLDKNDIEILDHTGQKYDHGQNLEILAVEKDPNISESTIKETKEPTILYKGQVIRVGKVIIVDKE